MTEIVKLLTNIVVLVTKQAYRVVLTLVLAERWKDPSGSRFE